MDAFAVAVAVSLGLNRITFRHLFRLSWHFGLFQALMTIAGWFVGEAALSVIGNAGRWFACGILCLIGLRMLRESFRHDMAKKDYDSTRGISLVSLSVATSIDAFVVGISLGLIKTAIVFPALVIGLVALVLTAAGMGIGRYAGELLESWAERLGGIVLVGIGIKILLGM